MPESQSIVMATEALAATTVIDRSNKLTSSNKLGQVVEAYPALSAIQADGTIQLVINIAPAPKILATNVTNSTSVTFPYVTRSSALPLSVPHTITDTAPQSVPTYWQ